MTGYSASVAYDFSKIVILVANSEISCLYIVPNYEKSWSFTSFGQFATRIMEVENPQATQEPTTPNDFAATAADLARTVSEQPLTVAASSPTSAADSPTVGVATITPPQGFSFQPQKHTLDLRQILARFKTAGIE